MDGPNHATKCAKRRRREPAILSTINQSANNNSKEIVGTQSTSTNSGAMKRSSQFAELAVYLGAYNEEEAAARAYDLAAIKYWGVTTYTNFPVSDYEEEIKIMQTVTKEEYLASLRRKSNGFSRGVSKYRGVARHHHNGRWEARIGRVFGNKYLYLGTYSMHSRRSCSSLRHCGDRVPRINAVTNFDLSTYIKWLKPGATNYGFTSQDQSLTDEPRLLQPSFVTDEMSLEYNQQFVAHQPLRSASCRRSSSTALNLLLRSSMFRELVEKNLNTVNSEGIEVAERKDEREQLRDECNAIFYIEDGDEPQHCYSDGDNGQYFELQETAARIEQSLWSCL
uniref:AP2/ERF domain-containing protein n=1 Tax=Ananas comosus var. bracteatus TaxID=296719 RepID=A0A6V7QJL9_ANACO|nr:unnamed protein product [Ananas comosus var. bracteatus]